MKTIAKCPRSGQTSSKRVIALTFAGLAGLLSLVLAALIVARPSIDVEVLKILASTIGVFSLAATGTQATSMTSSKNTGRQDYAEPTTYTDR